ISWNLFRLVVSIARPLLRSCRRRADDSKLVFRPVRQAISQCYSTGIIDLVSANKSDRGAVLDAFSLAQKKERIFSLCHYRWPCGASRLQLGSFWICPCLRLSGGKFERSLSHRLARHVSQPRTFALCLFAGPVAGNSGRVDFFQA